MKIDASLILNQECYCCPIDREDIVQKIINENAAPHMEGMLADRPHYFANTKVFLSESHLSDILDQVQAIESVVKLPAFAQHVQKRSVEFELDLARHSTKGVFMGYDFHITGDGPKLIEINSNAGGAFIVNMIENASQSSSGKFETQILQMFIAEWGRSGHQRPLKTIAIVDETPPEQYHYPDMCLAKTLLETQGIDVVITDPRDLSIKDGKVFHGNLQIDLIYNRLTDFNLSEPNNQIVLQAYRDHLAVVSPAPHHHALYADKRNLITLSNPEILKSFGAKPEQIEQLKSIPMTSAVSDQMWRSRRSLFFKPQAGFGSRGAFRGAKLTKKVWGEILKGDYIAQDRVIPPLRAVKVGGEKISLKFDVRVYTFDGVPLLFAARVYQGQTTNLRTAGGGLAAVIPIPETCLNKVSFNSGFETCADVA